MPGHRLSPCRARLRVALLCAALATVCLLGVPAAGSAAVPCWQRLIADWSRDGRVDRTYPLACYRQAVKRLPEDLKTYSSAPDDISRALTERRSRLRSVQPVAAASLPTVVARSGGLNPLLVIVPGVGALLLLTGLTARLVQARPRR